MEHSILVVDDESDNVDALERLFRKKHHVLKATSGKDALQILKDNKVSLIVSDQRMPHMSGVDFLAKSQKIRPEAMRILLTGYTDIDSVISAINTGQIYRYVTKPWDPVDLTATVDRAIEQFELSAELKDKNIALSKALAELKVLDEAKTQFMVLINHELKTPLTVMLSYLELLGETPLSEEQTKFLSRVNSAAARLQQLISDSLELVSAEAGLLKTSISSTTTSELFKNLESDFEEALSKRELSLLIDDPILKLKTDARLLRTVFSRLLDNASKFAKEGSSIHVQAEARSNGIEFIIANEGKPIGAAQIDKILRPFSLDENMLNHSKGTGLGLTLCRAILNRLDSELSIECIKGLFTVRFTVRTPDK